MIDLNLEYADLSKANTIAPIKFVVCMGDAEEGVEGAATVSFNHLAEHVTDMIFPCGTIIDYYNPIATIKPHIPVGWFLCDGSTFDEEFYPELAIKLGGNTLPDLRGSAVIMSDFNNGILSPADADSVGVSIGINEITLETAHLPPHAHAYTDTYKYAIVGPEHTNKNGSSLLGYEGIVKQKKFTSSFPEEPHEPIAFDVTQPSINTLKIIKATK